MTMRPPPPTRVPTLTEVVALPEAPPAASVAAPPVTAPPMPAAPARSLDEDELVRRVLADVQRQVELMLEVKLREALAPVLTRATDALMREARNELASTLREVVARAVAQEIARHRGR
jgi:hypothetical protein